jgi:hypothetical protein
MFRILVAGLALFAGSASTTVPERAEPIASFSLVLESSSTGWAARCDSGCRWTQLSFNCERACGAIIDANGVVTLATQRQDSAAFRFVVEHTPTGAKATTRGGTAWQTLSWDCGVATCRARVNENGVSGVVRTR